MSYTVHIDVRLPDTSDDPTHFLQQVLNDLRSQGRWQMDLLTGEKGVPLRDPTTFRPVGTIFVREES